MPAYSPDGSFVAFVSNRSGKPEVWVAQRDGGEARKLTTGSYVSSTPRWSPSGGRLTYGAAVPPRAQDERSAHGLFVVPVAGGEPQRLPLGRQSAADPEWTADGGMLQYWSGEQLWRVRPDGSGAAKVGEFPVHFLRLGAAAPGGRSLLYVRSAAPFDLRIAAMDGSGDDHVLASGILGPAFAVTGKFVYFIKAADQSLYAQPLDGGSPRRVRRIEFAGRLILGMTASPDDTSIVWANTEMPRVDLMLVRDFR